MSGHSKWSTIKHKKAANDAKKGATYTKLGRNITLAARDGGGDLETNFKLRLAVDLAKASNMPTENIERAIKRGTGELKDAAAIQEVTYEAYGPGAVPMLIDVATDNSNRSVTDIRKIITGHGGNMGSVGSVSWQFEEVGLIVIRPAVFKKSEHFGKADEVEERDSEEGRGDVRNDGY
jgi:YebC/PmpR family DNA-binding regulatory protein